MTPNNPQFDRRPVGAISLLRGGLALELSPCAGALKTAIRSLAAKTWSHPVTGRDVQFAAVTIERWYYTARHGHDDPVGALRRAVRKDCGKVSLAAAARRAADSPVPRPPALELPTALRQPRRFGEGRSFAGAAPLLFHGQALHAGSRPGAQAEASSQATPRRSRAPKTDARPARVRSYEADVRRGAVASRFPPRIAQGAHSRRPVAAPDRAGHPR